MFKKIFLIAIFIFGLAVAPAQAGTSLDIYIFYGDGCPHCKKEKAFLEQLLQADNSLSLHYYEVWNNKANAALLEKIGRQLGVKISGVPIIFIGNEPIVGFDRADTTGQRIQASIDKYHDRPYTDKIRMIINNQALPEDVEKTASTDQTEISVPFFGKIDLKSFSLPALTIIIGAVDGFNPCALWILLFLMSLLLPMGDRKRMWILGTAFIVTSGLVYLVFLSAWLNFNMFLVVAPYLRQVIALVALGSAVFYLRSYYKNRDGGCEVVDTEEKKKIFYRIRNVINNNNLLLAFGGICLLAISVNLLEFLCSIGLPAVYTNLLAGSGVSLTAKYLYLFLYILAYESEAIIVFLLTMWTAKLTGISPKFGQYSRLIGGFIMLAIGLLLLFRPAWIMLS